MQFALVTVHSIQLLFMNNCQYPKLFAYWILSYALIFMGMFANFYIQAYRKPASSGKQIETNGKSRDPVKNGREKVHWC